jgi:hypothetical protein
MYFENFGKNDIYTFLDCPYHTGLAWGCNFLYAEVKPCHHWIDTGKCPLKYTR